MKDRDKTQANEVALNAIESAQADMDIQAADLKPDDGKWEKLYQDMSELLLVAYYRNHNKSVL